MNPKRYALPLLRQLNLLALFDLTSCLPFACNSNIFRSTSPSGLHQCRHGDDLFNHHPCFQPGVADCVGTGRCRDMCSASGVTGVLAVGCCDLSHTYMCMHKLESDTPGTGKKNAMICITLRQSLSTARPHQLIMHILRLRMPAPTSSPCWWCHPYILLHSFRVLRWRGACQKLERQRRSFT